MNGSQNSPLQQKYPAYNRFGRNNLSRYKHSAAGLDTMSRYSGTSSQSGMKEYWDLLSVEDAIQYTKDMAKEKEAKRLAQRQLKSCLEGQMRERGLKLNFNQFKNNAPDQLMIDKLKELDVEHLQKRQNYLHSIDRKVNRYENRLEKEKMKLQNAINNTTRNERYKSNVLRLSGSYNDDNHNSKRKKMEKRNDTLAQIIQVKRI